VGGPVYVEQSVNCIRQVLLGVEVDCEGTGPGIPAAYTARQFSFWSGARLGHCQETRGSKSSENQNVARRNPSVEGDPSL
jgi:hypothetical protein